MKKSFGSIAFSFLLCTSAPSLRAQCGNDGDLPGTQKSYGWQTHFTAVTRLGNHFMPGFGDGDSMTEPLWLTGGANPGFGSTGLRETWYVPRDNLPNTAAIHRLFNPGAANHLDSWITGGSGYNWELTHGYPWTYQRAGT